MFNITKENWVDQEYGWTPESGELVVPVPGLAIDPVGTECRDDAIWWRRTANVYQIIISIVDPSAHVSIGSYEDQRAARLLQSRYMPDTVLTMFPEEMISGKLSMGACTWTPSLSVVADIDQAGSVINTRIGMTQAACRLMTYPEADKAMMDHHPLSSTLQMGYMLAHNLMVARKKRGSAIPIYDLAKGKRTDEEGFFTIIPPGRLHCSFISVQETMILANGAVAEMLQSAGKLALWRQNLRPGDPAVITLEPGFHAGLGLSAYLNFTSPDRRYPDLVNMRIAIAYLLGLPDPYSASELELIANRLNRSVSGPYLLASANLLPLPKEKPLSLIVRQLWREVDGAGSDPVDLQAVLRQLEGVLKFKRLRTQDLYRLLFASGDSPAWEAVRAKILEFLKTKPGRAKNVLLQWISSSGLGELAVVTRRQNGCFRVSLTFPLEGEEWRIEKESKKPLDAKKDAYYELLSLVVVTIHSQNK